MKYKRPDHRSSNWWCILLLTWILAPNVLTVEARGGQSVHYVLPAAKARVQPVQRLAEANQMRLAIGLPLRNTGELGQLLSQIYDPASPNYRHYLTTEQFTKRFGPTESDYQAVARFAESNGLRVAGRHPNRLLLDVTGAVADVERALHLKMFVYQHPTEARTFYAPDVEPMLDSSVPVLGISGLDDYSPPRPRFVQLPLIRAQNASPNAGSGPQGYYMGKDFRAAYVPDTILTGSGQSVGMLEFDGYTATDISYYELLAGSSSVTLSNVLLDGFSGRPTGSGGEVEVSLDIEMAVSMAPGLNKVIVYEAGPEGNWHDILNRMADDNLAKQLSCSWYSPGGGPDPVAEQIFEQMAAQGQTMFCASGDYDAYTGLIPFPSDSTNVVEVGGTTLTTSGPVGSWNAETVWNRGDGIGSGGGISTGYTIPSWQTNISMAANQGSTTMHNVPDVALTADNVYVRADGEDEGVGGTSCAAPLWAGFTALVNQQATLSGRPVVGFIDPALDTIGSGANYASCFHDIVTGNSTSGASPNKFFATSGYDLCTGWGTPAGQNLINALATPDPLGILPTAGFTAIGGSGGPFTATSESFVLTNLGTNSFNWSLVNTSAWLTVSLSGGTIPVGGSNNTTVSLAAAAYGLPIGNYSVVIEFSNVTTGIAQGRQFTLEVVPSVPPGIVTQPSNQTIFVDFTASFSVTANGTPPLNYQWAFDGTNISGATDSSLTLTDVSYSQAGSYSVVVTNTLGATNSASAVLTVNPPPPCAPLPAGIVSWWPAEGNAEDIIGTNNGTLIGGASFGPGEVGQAFAFNGANQYVEIADSPSLRPASVTLECWFNLSNSAGGNLISKPVGTGQNDSYQYLAVNGYIDGNVGSASSVLNIRYDYPFVLGVWYHAALTFDSSTETETLYLNGNAVVSGTTGFQIGYDANPALIGADYDFGKTVIPMNGRIDEASIYDRALTPAEIASIYAAGFTGKCAPGPTPPTIVTQPTNQTIFVGSTANFDVLADGTAPLIYQWQFNGTNINGATNALLTLTNASPGETGSYSVFITNTLGATNSASAVLTVNPPPPCDPAPSGIISWWPAEDNAEDIIGTNNGTLIAGASFAPGEVGQAFAFNGANQYVEIPDSPSLRPASVTLECWFNLSNSAGGNLISKPVGTGQNDSYQYLVVNGYIDGNVGSVSSVLNIRYDYPFVPGVWYHAALTFDSSTKTETLYLNGNAVVSGTTGFQIGYDANPALIGADYDSGKTVIPMSGRIDEASIYDRALTQAEINAIYQAGTNGKCPPPATAPTILVQPQGETVAVGSPASFNVTAAGSPPLSYQWSDTGTNIASATNSSFTLTNAQTTNTGVYAVTISNAAGSVTSSNAMLSVGYAPSIISQPLSQEVPQGASVTFMVGASGSAPLDYQWSVAGVAIQQATNSTLTLTNVQTANAGAYRVAVSSPFGAALSSNAVLTVDFAPVIVTQPTNQTIFVGFPASFSVTANGTPPPNYQWAFDGTNINGATNASLTLSQVIYSQAGSYSVVVTNTLGATNSASAVLTVNPPPPCAPVPSGIISWWPAEGNADDIVGTNNGELIGGASFGPGEVGQAFAFNGANQYVEIADSPSLRPASVTLECWFNLSNSTGGNLISKPVGTGRNDSYQYLAVNGYIDGNVGTVSSVLNIRYDYPFVLGVWYHAALTFDSSTETETLYLNGNAVVSGTTGFQIGYDANPALIGADYDSGNTVIPMNGRIDEASIYDRALTPAEIASIYAAGFTGKCGRPPTIVVQPENQSATVNSPATFCVVGDGMTPLYYQWQFNQTNLLDATNSCLTLPVVRLNEGGVYNVIVSNVSGSITSAGAVLTVIAAPIISRPPASQSVESNCAAAFGVAVTGAPPLVYQWWQNGSALVGQTNSSLALPSVQGSNFGSYSIVITNAFGSVTSVVAVLALASPPVANPDTILRFAEGGFRLDASDLTTNDTVALYDTLTVTAVSSTSAAGGEVGLYGSWIYYAPPASNPATDTFAYTVSDGHCGTAVGIATIEIKPDNPQPLNFAIAQMAGGPVQLTCDGIPGGTYSLQYTDSLLPANWQMLTNQTADGFGVVQFTDWPATNPPTRFYRAVGP